MVSSNRHEVTRILRIEDLEFIRANKEKNNRVKLELALAQIERLL